MYTVIYINTAKPTYNLYKKPFYSVFFCVRLITSWHRYFLAENKTKKIKVEKKERTKVIQKGHDDQHESNSYELYEYVWVYEFLYSYMYVHMCASIYIYTTHVFVTL